MANRQGQITNIKDLLLSKLDAQGKQEFNQMTVDEQEEMIKGFKECIKEYQDVVNAQDPQGGGLPGGLPGGFPPPPMPEIPDDGLDHWTKRQKQQGGGSDGENPDKRRKISIDGEDNLGGDGPLQMPENDLKQTDKDVDNMNGQQASSDAQSSSTSAQAAADQAQAAADQAQDIADSASQNSGQSGVNAGDAQDAASKAQEQADKAQQEAEAARDAEDLAQEAARNGDEEGAKEAAKEARRHARNAKQAAERAKQLKDAAMQSTTGQQNKSGQNKQQGQQQQKNSQQNDEYGDPDGEITDVEIDVEGSLDFDGDDRCCDEDDEENDPQKKMEKLAKQAGQPLGPGDYENPCDREKRLFEEAKQKIKEKYGKTGTPNHSKGDGNSLIDLLDKLDELFRVSVDWKSTLKKMFNATTKSDHKMIMAKRRMGVDSDHPLYKGRYQHPKMHEFEKEDGIVQVFFLVDNSGSMGFDSPEGKKNLRHILSEIIGLEEQTKVKKSAIAYFGAGAISEENIRTWTLKQCKNKEALLNIICRHPGDQGGGTSLDVALNSVIALGKPYYSARPPETLMIVITDGWDSYDFIGKKLDQRQKARTIFLIANDSDPDLNKIKEELSNQGILDHHILLVNTKEWEY